MSAVLLDVNLLIALAWPQHVHHNQAHKWFTQASKKPWATCALTQTAFVRISSNPKIIPEAVSPRDAVQLLEQVTLLPNHVFWKKAVPVTQTALFKSVSFIGHRQVTDAYLIALAHHHAGRIATFDKGLIELVFHNPELTATVELLR